MIGLGLGLPKKTFSSLIDMGQHISRFACLAEQWKKDRSDYSCRLSTCSDMKTDRVVDRWKLQSSNAGALADDYPPTRAGNIGAGIND
ncbi:hypothetical protein P8452_19634 [Trifolium repens]|nr:hypothetical protein P8452_19634 [Trifolium repens]